MIGAPLKVLVTGGQGQLASALREVMECGGVENLHIPPTYAQADFDYPTHDDLDITDDIAVRSWFDEHGPYDLVINCASMTNVDYCETDEPAAFLVNAVGVLNLARATEACRGKFVQISTDYVFPGLDQSPRAEDDRIYPISAYGRSKWAGEVMAELSCSRTFIIRTAWLYGKHGSNFVKTMIRLARQNGVVSVVNDQFGNPTNAKDLATAILIIACTNDYGVYHCTNSGVCSWFDFACAILDNAKIECEREGISSEEYKKRFPASANRPKYSALRNEHLRHATGQTMRPWQTALESFFESQL